MKEIEKKGKLKKWDLCNNSSPDLPSRPDSYPVPDVEELLFFIQRNYNTDSIIYKVNRSKEGLIHLNEPIEVYWIKYSENETIKHLNYLQKKLAYGYTSKQVSNDLFEFQFVSYPKRFFLVRENDSSFIAVTSINGIQSIIEYVYIHADEDGVFPDVRFIEFYGKSQKTGESVYEKLIL